MLIQLFVGTCLIVLTVALSAALIGLGIEGMMRARPWLERHAGVHRIIVALTVVTTWLVFLLTIVLWIWAWALFGLKIFPTLEESLYFSMVVFTTLGVEAEVVPREWRLLTGFLASNGFLLFGLYAAFLFEVMRRLRETHAEFRGNRKDAGRNVQH